jgi:peptidoglycan/xylan/chitin deacetylase (PgdA/CDA1 family)
MKLFPKVFFVAIIMLAAIFFAGRPIVASTDILSSATVSIETPSKVKILVYHSIAPIPATKESPMALHYRITPETFDLQMQYLKDHGYHTITLGTLIADISQGITPTNKEVVLTFDDGWRNQYAYAMPILEKYGFTATFGIISKNVGSAISVNSTESGSAGSKMTWAQIKDLQARGFEIASHSETHPFLTHVSDQQLVTEITGSKKMLETKLGTSITSFVYPYYNYDARVLQAVKDAGYLGARAGYNVFSNTQSHLYELVAQEVLNTQNPFYTTIPLSSAPSLQKNQ